MADIPCTATQALPALIDDAAAIIGGDALVIATGTQTGISTFGDVSDLFGNTILHT